MHQYQAFPSNNALDRLPTPASLSDVEAKTETEAQLTASPQLRNEIPGTASLLPKHDYKPSPIGSPQPVHMHQTQSGLTPKTEPSPLTLHYNVPGPIVPDTVKHDHTRSATVYPQPSPQSALKSNASAYGEYDENLDDDGEESDIYDSSSQSASMMRRRLRPSQVDARPKPRFKALVESVDLFPKVQEESVVETKSGFVSTIITLLVIAFLLISELSIYYSSKTSERMTIDALPSERLKTYFDIEFPALRCSQTIIEVMDVTGSPHEVSFDNITKQRIRNGKPISEPMSAYEELQFKLANPEEKDEGCRVRGHIVVTKVAGNMHVAVGAMVVTKSRRHVHNFSRNQMMAYNASHIVHALDFGERFTRKASYTAQPTLSHSPLSGVEFMIKPNSPPATVRYFIKVVPTTFKSEVTGVTFNTNQYTYTDVVSYIDPEKPVGKSIPGVFFVYDFSPYRILVTESPGYSTTGFIVTLCALIAGVVTIAGVVDSIVYYVSKSCHEPNPIV